jgi:hypothetical protein
VLETCRDSAIYFSSPLRSTCLPQVSELSCSACGAKHIDYVHYIIYIDLDIANVFGSFNPL